MKKYLALVGMLLVGALGGCVAAMTQGPAKGATSGTTLLGNASIARTADNNSDGLAEAFRFTAGTTGTAQAASVYVDSGSSARTLIVGLYTNSSSGPSKLVAQGSVQDPTSSAWNQISLSGAVTSGTKYWLAVLGTGGQINFRDNSSGCSVESQNSASSSLTSLPSTWANGSRWPSCNVSAYLTGSPPTPTTTPSTTTTTPTTTTPTTTTSGNGPTITAAPVLSGYATEATTYPQPQGGTFNVPASEMTVSPGTWSDSSATLTYQWQHCSAGACSDVSELGQGGYGNCSSTTYCYIIQPSDAGDTMQVLVTATDASGSTTTTATTSATAGALVTNSQPVPCALSDSAQSCWEANDGVASSGCTEAQIEAQSPAQCGPPYWEHVTGDLTISSPNTVIDHEWISGCVAIDGAADNVTIRDSLIESQDFCHGDSGPTAGSTLNMGNSASAPTGTVIVDSTVDGDGVAGDAYGIFGNDYTALRVYDHGTDKEIGGGENMLILDSLADNLAPNDQCAHANNYWFDSAQNSVLAGSYGRTNGLTSDTCVTATVNLGADYGAPTYDMFTGNYLDGYDAVDWHGGCGATNITMANNARSSNNSSYGDAWNSVSSNVWSGNYDPTDGSSVGPVGPPSC